MPEGHSFEQITAMLAGGTDLEIWLLGSNDQSAAYAAYFGMAFSFADFINLQRGRW